MIKRFKNLMPGMKAALDCGAGIGRVAKKVLKPIFSAVDLVEPSSVQLDKARKFVPEARNFYEQGLQEFSYKDCKYDAVWIQWVLCYLTDDDIVSFLVKTKLDGLTRNKIRKTTGLIFIKENTSPQSKFLCDFEQNAVWRNKQQFRALFEIAGYNVVLEEEQTGTEVRRSNIMPITCYVL